MSLENAICPNIFSTSNTSNNRSFSLDSDAFRWLDVRSPFRMPHRTRPGGNKSAMHMFASRVFRTAKNYDIISTISLLNCSRDVLCNSPNRDLHHSHNLYAISWHALLRLNIPHPRFPVYSVNCGHCKATERLCSYLVRSPGTVVKRCHESIQMM